MHRALIFLAWATAAGLVAALIAWVVVKWAAVRIARRVADLAERPHRSDGSAWPAADRRSALKASTTKRGARATFETSTGSRG
jgi:hypothetical protein